MSSVSSSSRRSVRLSSLSRCSVSRSRDRLVRLVDDPPDLAVDHLLRRLGDLRDAGQQRALGVGRDHGDRPDRLAHPPAADHLARDPGQLLDVGLGAGRDRAVHELLGDPPAERDLDPRRQVLLVVVRALAVGLEIVTPSDIVRGMIETLRTGSAPGVSMPTIAWPASW